jgi:DNA repair protein RecO (recombination protein O)
MLHKTKGIVLRTVKYSETSVITTIYTREHGLLSFIVQGVRSSKAKNKAALFHPMNQLDLEIYLKENKNLLRIKEYRSYFMYEQLSIDVVRSSIGFFYTEVLNKVIKEEETNTSLFDFISSQFIQLDSEKLNVLSPQLFLLQLSTYLGFNPQGNYNEQNSLFDLKEGVFTNHPNSFNLFIPFPLSKYMDELLQHLSSGTDLPHISYTERKELLQYLIKYYMLHIENFKSLHTLKIIEEILS